MDTSFLIPSVKLEKIEGGLFNSGLAEDVFYQFLDEAVAKEIAKSPNNFGIAASVAKELPGY